MRYILAIALIIVGCDSTQRERDRSSTVDASLLDANGEHASNVDGSHSQSDVVVVDAAYAEIDSTFDEEPEEESPEQSCDAEDDDGDGRVDEGVANPCGGCGGIPPGGCQHWRIQLVADAEGHLDPRRTVSLAASFLGVSTVEVPNGECVVQRLQTGQERDGHLGVVTFEREDGTYTFRPEYDPENSAIMYTHDLAEPWIGLSDGESIALNAQGGSEIPEFQMQLTGPPILELQPADALTDFVEAIRGREDGAAPELNWTSQQDDEGLRFYIGGSRVVFRRVGFYQAIEHYVLDGRLADDGAFTLPDAFIGAGIAEASTWVHASRLRSERRVFGPHAVSIQTGSRLEARGRGGMLDADMPPFQIQNPNPNTRDFTPGDPLPVRWSELPDGDGPLRVMLSYRDPVVGGQTIITCTAIDPHLGELILPAQMTIDVPDGDGDFRQISVRWNQDTLPLEAPDSGVFTRATSVILNFTR